MVANRHKHPANSVRPKSEAENRCSTPNLAHAAGILRDILFGWEDCADSFRDWCCLLESPTKVELNLALEWEDFKFQVVDEFYDMLGSSLEGEDEYPTPWDAFLEKQWMDAWELGRATES